MPAPLFSLPTSGSAPNEIVGENAFEAEVNRVVGELWSAAVVADLPPETAEELAAQVAANATAAAAADDGAQAAQAAAEVARDAALLSRGIFASTAAGLSNGVAAVTITAPGTSGTDGEFALAFSGGGGTGAAGTFTVSGGSIVSVNVTHPGTGYTSAPTPDFTASSGLTGVTATVAIAPRNPVGTYFSVPGSGDDSLILYRVDAGPVATEVARYPATAVITAAQSHVVEPFPLTDWEVPIALNQTASPNAALAFSDRYEIAAGARFYCAPAISGLGLAVGDRVRVAFRRTAGTGQPAEMTFRAGLTLVSTVPFALRGGWWIAEAVIPATTDIIRIDWTNSTGGAVTISRPLFAKRALPQRIYPVPERQQFDDLLRSRLTLPNLWPGDNAGISVAYIAGTGSAGDAVVSSDGTVTIPADFQGRLQGFAISRPVGATMTVLMFVPEAIGAMRVRFVGATTGTQLIAAWQIGGGWWRVTATIDIAGSTAINELRIEPDNRNVSAVLGIPNGLPRTIQRIIVVDGAQIPSALAAPAVTGTTYPEDEIVVTQGAGAFQVSMLAGPEKYIQHQMTRYNDPGSRAIGWRQSGLVQMTRTGDTSFSPGIALTDNGEVEVAIREFGKTDFMGGATHGDMEETRPLTLLIDGQQVTLDGSTPYRARRVEAIQRAELLEADNATRTVSATLVTRWLWEREEMRLSHWLRWERNMQITLCYLAMLPILRHVGANSANPLISAATLSSPEFAAFDTSFDYGNDAPWLNARTVKTVGAAGIITEMDVQEGWSASGRSKPFGNPSRNKIYFVPFPANPSPGQSVTAGSVIEFATRYRVGLT